LGFFETLLMKFKHRSTRLNTHLKFFLMIFIKQNKERKLPKGKEKNIIREVERMKLLFDMEIMALKRGNERRRKSLITNPIVERDRIYIEFCLFFFCSISIFIPRVLIIKIKNFNFVFSTFFFLYFISNRLL
jgi:hypothetical protein